MNVAVLYCGSSLTRSLYNKILELGPRPFMMPSDTPLNEIRAVNPSAIVITGSPDYVNSPFGPKVDTDIYASDIPILGVCYGMQRMAVDLGGKVMRMAWPERECVPMKLTDEPSPLFHDFADDEAPVWMLHTCKVTHVPEGFSVTGFTEETEVAAMEDEERGLFAVQFHPEHKGKDPSCQAGTSIIWNFFVKVCGYDGHH